MATHPESSRNDKPKGNSYSEGNPSLGGAYLSRLISDLSSPSGSSARRVNVSRGLPHPDPPWLPLLPVMELQVVEVFEGRLFSTEAPVPGLFPKFFSLGIFFL